LRKKGKEKVNAENLLFKILSLHLRRENDQKERRKEEDYCAPFNALFNIK
jgi:hypothetical protein